MALDNLKRLAVPVGMVATIAGVYFTVYAPTPATQTMANLRDAGWGDGQKLVRVCSEHLTPKAKRRVQRQQPGFLRPQQACAIVARVGACFQEDGGPANCFSPAGVPVRPGDVFIPSLRFDPDAGVDAAADDGGEDDADDSKALLPGCVFVRCADFDAGDVPVPYQDGDLCGGGNRMMALRSPCMVPNCWTKPDGGWDDSATPQCFRPDPFTGAPVFAGCAPIPAEVASGPDCLPSVCVVDADDPAPACL